MFATSLSILRNHHLVKKICQFFNYADIPNASLKGIYTINLELQPIYFEIDLYTCINSTFPFINTCMDCCLE